MSDFDNHTTKGKSVFNFIRALCVIIFFGLLTACGGKGGEQYYQYKEGESNAYAADAKCRQYADQTASADDITTNSLHQQRFGIDFIQYEPAAPADSLGPALEKYYKSKARQRRWLRAYQSCMAQLGWLPCSQGGTAAHGCK